LKKARCMLLFDFQKVLFGEGGQNPEYRVDSGTSWHISAGSKVNIFILKLFLFHFQINFVF